jgi:hypothetical protein
MTPIPVSLAVEGLLDEQVLRVLIAQSHKAFAVGVCYGKRGKNHLRENILRFNHAAAHVPFIILADLDDVDCAPDLIRHWLPRGCHTNLILRIAVREIESWLMADREHLADFLGIASTKIPIHPDECADPKIEIINLARRSSKHSIREDLIPDSPSRVGKNYIGQLTWFVTTKWRATHARKHSPSLDSAINALAQFNPRI